MGRVINEEEAFKVCKCAATDGLFCFSEGVIGTLSKEQIAKCKTKIPLPKESEEKLRKRYTEFVAAVHAASERYHKEDHNITKWLHTVGEEMRKREIEL